MFTVYNSDLNMPKLDGHLQSHQVKSQFSLLRMLLHNAKSQPSSVSDDVIAASGPNGRLPCVVSRAAAVGRVTALKKAFVKCVSY